MRATIQHLARQIRARAISPVEIARDALARIEQLNSKLNAFITVLAESAMADALRAEQEIHRGIDHGPLHGIPIGLKDIVDTAGIRTTAASAQYKDRVPAEDAEVVRRLRQAGAVILGKQNLHEFAYGGSSMISLFGEVHNPWNIARVAGGSSGGSAASVGAGLGVAALGTDTAGSIRLPAAYCGLVGLKPTHGRVSARGVVPLSLSYDHIGPITNSVHDAAIMLQVLAGFDGRDPTSANVPVDNFTAALGQPLPKIRIDVLREFFFAELDSDVAAAIETALDVFRSLKAEVRDVSLRDFNLEVSSDRTLSSAESWAFHQPMVEKSPELYHPATLARIRSGEKTSESQMVQARKKLQEDRNAIRAVFELIDILLTPTVPMPPPEIAGLLKHPENLRPAELIMLRNTRPFNVWGVPAISIPCGFTPDGLPIGLQLAAAPWREALLLQAAHAYEQATEWHLKAPQMPRST